MNRGRTDAEKLVACRFGRCAGQHCPGDFDVIRTQKNKGGRPQSDPVRFGAEGGFSRLSALRSMSGDGPGQFPMAPLPGKPLLTVPLEPSGTAGPAGQSRHHRAGERHPEDGHSDGPHGGRLRRNRQFRRPGEDGAVSSSEVGTRGAPAFPTFQHDMSNDIDAIENPVTVATMYLRGRGIELVASPVRAFARIDTPRDKRAASSTTRTRRPAPDRVDRRPDRFAEGSRSSEDH
jgi:hypothetical protein